MIVIVVMLFLWPQIAGVIHKNSTTRVLKFHNLINRG